MSQALVPLITDAGLAASFNASNTGISATITHVGVGSGSYTPTTDQTGLVSEKQRVPVADGEKSAPTQIHLSAIVEGSDQYWINEVGFFLEDGTLLAVWSDPNPYSYITYSNSELDGTVTVVGYGGLVQVGNYLLEYLGSSQFQLTSPDNSILGIADLDVEYSDDHLTFIVTGAGWVIGDQAQIKVWSSKPLGWKSADVDFVMGFDLLLSALPADSITVNATGANLNLSASDKALVNMARSQIEQNLRQIQFNDRLLLLGV